jgi:hypothetical protein
MRKIILFLIPFLLFAEESSKYKISADNIVFNKNNLHFENGFYLEHSFGKIFAKKANFTNFKKGTFFNFTLTDGVKLITNNNGTLTSDNADFDSVSSKIRFYSNNYVNFDDQIKKKNINIRSKEVECLLNTKNCAKINIEDIYSISFLEDVLTTIESKFKIYSDKAVFENKENASNIYLYPKENKFCLFTYEDSEINTPFAKLDLNNSDLIFDHPNGTIKNLLKKQNIVCFSSDKLIWHNFENSLLLTDNVQIIDSQFGIILSDEVEIVKKIKENAIKKIITRKNTTINFFSKTKANLTTKGIIELDHEKKQISAFSLKKQNQDLIYEDSNVYITAKKAKLNYNLDKTIQNITLENDVRFIYQKDKNSLGYGIADKVEYFPIEKTIKLMSEANKKVLFWQKDNSLKLSANEIHINQKEKNDIKGLGDVRFTFNLEEENLINEIFSKYMSYE